jgi:farnesol dehydrogenase
MVVFVTGGTGYLGQTLLTALRAGGKRARVLVRPESDTRSLATGNTEIVIGDVRNPASVQAAMSGCQAVIHAAALTGSSGRSREFEQVNVEGFRNVMDAAWRHGIRRIVNVSSFHALGPSFGEVRGEDHLTVARHHPGEHERTKVIAERLANSYLSGGLPIVTVYPTVLYGPGPLRDGNLVSRLIVDRSKGRLATIPCKSHHRLSFAYVEDVACAIVNCLGRARPGERFILGGENVTAFDFFATLIKVTQKKVVSRKVGVGARSRFAEWGARLAGKSSPQARAVKDLLTDDWAFSSENARMRLRYMPRGFEEGMKTTVDWLGRRGLMA